MELRLQSGGQIPIKLTGNIYETLILDKIKTCLLSLKIHLQQFIVHTIVTKERFLKVHTETARIYIYIETWEGSPQPQTTDNHQSPLLDAEDPGGYS